MKLINISRCSKEPNVGRGYIKELCFSPDGRVIASPFGHGVRLLTFNPQCADMVYNLSQSTIVGSRCHAIDKEPAYTLHELSTTTSHSDVVVTTKFSPTHPVFVSGCLGGKIIWHQPLLWSVSPFDLYIALTFSPMAPYNFWNSWWCPFSQSCDVHFSCPNDDNNNSNKESCLQ